MLKTNLCIVPSSHELTSVDFKSMTFRFPLGSFFRQACQPYAEGVSPHANADHRDDSSLKSIWPLCLVQENAASS